MAFDPSFSAAMLTDLRTYLTSIGVGESTTGYKRTIAQSFAIMQTWDGLVTQLSRTLRLRKALIQAPLFWEMRKLTFLDDAGDLAVQAYHAGQPGTDDCSTGLGQIFARTAILSNNYCTQQGIDAGTVLNAENRDHVWMIWKVLHDQDEKNVETIPLVLLRNASLAGFARPGLDATETVTKQLLELYNGTGDGAVKYGGELLGVYRVFEKYHRIIRER